MNWLTVMKYLCHKWPLICSTCRKHSPDLSSFMTYQNYFTSYGNNFISSWIFSIKGKNVKLPRCLKPFSCLIVFGVYIWLLVIFASFSPSCPLQKLPIPLSDPFLKLDHHLCSHLLRHCICLMHEKYRIGGKAVELLEIEKVKISRSQCRILFYLKKSKFWLLIFLWLFLIRFRSSCYLAYDTFSTVNIHTLHLLMIC